MTDAVTKNLSVEKGISQVLDTDYVPLHILCKSHTMEGLGRANIQVLSEIEVSINFPEKIEAMNLGIKRFTRGGKAFVFLE